MTIDMKDFLSAVTDVLHRIDYIKPEDLPNIDLYMDQGHYVYGFPVRGIEALS